jgi:hypothetical protein
MLKDLSGNRIESLIPLSLILLCVAVFMGCAAVGMNEWDYKMQKEGYFLHCSEMIDDKCITYQYFNSVQNTYQRYHHGTSLNGTSSDNN